MPDIIGMDPEIYREEFVSGVKSFSAEDTVMMEIATEDWWQQLSFSERLIAMSLLRNLDAGLVYLAEKPLPSPDVHG